MIRTEGVVLNEFRFQDTSKILNIYTEKFGKINVMAKGVYNPKSRLSAYTQPFIYSEYRLQKGRSFYYINEGNIINSFYNIRENIERVICGFYILELINKSTAEEEPNEKLFNLLIKTLETLSVLEKDFLKLVIGFELKFISFLGYRPFLEKCVSCGNSNFSKIGFSIENGGVLCENCLYQDRKVRPMNNLMYKAMHELLYTQLDNLEDIDIDGDTLDKIQKILEEYILFNIDRKELNSLNILKTII